MVNTDIVVNMFEVKDIVIVKQCWYQKRLKETLLVETLTKMKRRYLSLKKSYPYIFCTYIFRIYMYKQIFRDNNYNLPRDKCDWYVFLWIEQMKPGYWCGIFSLCCRPIGGLCLGVIYSFVGLLSLWLISYFHS